MNHTKSSTTALVILAMICSLLSEAFAAGPPSVGKVPAKKQYLEVPAQNHGPSKASYPKPKVSGSKPNAGILKQNKQLEGKRKSQGLDLSKPMVSSVAEGHAPAKTAGRPSSAPANGLKGISFNSLHPAGGSARHSIGSAKSLSTQENTPPAKRPSNQVVLGHYPEYMKLSDQLAARRFEIPKEHWRKMSEADKWKANQKFLDRMIKKGDEIILATPASQARSGSYYARELDYLKSQGYRLNSEGNKMLPSDRM